jgi:hypothetical protein
MKKKFKYDGKSRPSTDLYKKNFDIIFGKKIDTEKEEVTGYYYNGYGDKGVEVLTEKKVQDPFKKEVKKEKVNKKEIRDIEDRNGF